jgi:hypothetical protein
MINGNLDLRFILKPVTEYILLLRIKKRSIGPVAAWHGRDTVIVNICHLLVYQTMKNPTKSLLNDQVFNLMDALRSPVLTQSVSWSDCIPERLLNIIPMARLASLYKHDEFATDSECVAFIMTASMEAPLTSEWVDIYTHLSCKVCEHYWQEDHWKTVMAPKVLSDYDNNYLLKPLRRFIYEKRRKILKERMKEELKRPVQPEEMKNPLKPQLVECEQLTLF